MINCNISSLCHLCGFLMSETLFRTEFIPENPHEAVPESDVARTRGWLKVASSLADDFEWGAVRDRIALIEKKLRFPMTHAALAIELRVLRETIEAGSKEQLIYRYRREQAEIVMDWQNRWRSVLGKFPSAQTDILAAIDLWALGHSTASVFHFMRVLEHGLRALANNLGKSFDVQNWQNIIDQIEAEIRAQGKTLPAGARKSARLQFLSEAAKEFVYFKDGWRNYVSHSRGIYDAHQARSVLEHVKAFMTTLAAHLGEADELQERLP
jgi:hypothetical protein